MYIVTLPIAAKNSEPILIKALEETIEVSGYGKIQHDETVIFNPKPVFNLKGDKVIGFKWVRKYKEK